MRDSWVKVLAFQKKMNLACGDLSAPGLEDARFRLKLIKSEVTELEEAIEAGDLVEAADALADIDYLVIGAAIRWGIYLPDVFDEVHKTNMLKEGGIRDQDGKVMKPPGWKPPDIAGVLERQVRMEKSLARYHKMRSDNED